MAYLEGGDSLNALLLEGLQASTEGLLLGEEGLHGAEVPAVVLTAHLRLLVCYPRVYHICLPHELFRVMENENNVYRKIESLIIIILPEKF